MLSRITRASLLLGGAVATACSDSPTATIADTTKTNNNSTTTCTAPLTLTVGQVMPGITASSLCVSGGTTGAEYALIPWYGSTVSSASTTVSFTATGTSTPSASPDLISSSSASFDLSPSASPFTSSYPRNLAFDAKLRRRERASLAPLINGARSAMRRSSSTAQFDAIPSNPAIGQILRLNANSDSSCTAPDYRGGRVVAITNRAIVVADTVNPTGGYSDDEYASLGVAFDTLVDPMDRAAFGDPSDIDHNGKIVLFFTKAVNDLTPKTSTSFIGGFFDARDLLPRRYQPSISTAARGATSARCSTSWYRIRTRGGAFSKTNVASEVLGTLAHEYQHLINAARRMYVNTAATDFEETWLNEGLSHIAEELLFYRVSGLAPRANLDAPTIRSSSAYVTAFNNYESDNFGRYQEFLQSPTKYAPYSDNDSLATRGATCAFLRSAADKLAPTDADTWFRLVNSTTTGLANLRNVFGSTVTTQLRDWSTSVLTDDLTGVAATYQQPSWNYRSVFAALSSSVFPIATVSMTAGTRSVSLVAGSAAYTRFAVASGANGECVVDVSHQRWFNTRSFGRNKENKANAEQRPCVRVNEGPCVIKTKGFRELSHRARVGAVLQSPKAFAAGWYRDISRYHPVVFSLFVSLAARRRAHAIVGRMKRPTGSLLRILGLCVRARGDGRQHDRRRHSAHAGQHRARCCRSRGCSSASGSSARSTRCSAPMRSSELGTMLPRSGGQYVFARHAFGDYAGFLVGWMDWISTCASTGAIAIVLGESMSRCARGTAGGRAADRDGGRRRVHAAARCAARNSATSRSALRVC